MRSFAAFFIIPFLVDFALSGTGIVMNFRAQDLDATAFDLGLLGFAWGLPYMIGCMIVGRLAEHYPRKALMTLGLAADALLIWLAQWMPSPHTLALANVGIGIAGSLFWPVFEALISHEDKEAANRRMGAFNLGWTLGIGGGLAAGGFLSQWGFHQALTLLSALTAVSLLIFLSAAVKSDASPHLISEPVDTSLEEPTSIQLRLTYLYIAWVANFSLWFAAGTVNTLFPKLCRTLLIPDHTSGILIGLIMAGQAVAFYAISRTTSWHYRLLPMLFFQLLAIIGCALLGVSESTFAFAAAMLLMGVGRGLTYCCSLYYGIAAESGQVANAGIHEMLIGLSCAVGPLIGGRFAEYTDVPSTFLLCAFISLSGMAVEIFLWKKYSAATARNAPPPAAVKFVQ